MLPVVKFLGCGLSWRNHLSFYLVLIAAFDFGLAATPAGANEVTITPLPTLSDCPVCFCYWTGHRWRPVADTCGECECSEHMCSVHLKPPLSGSNLLNCPWYGCPSGMPGPPSSDLLTENTEGTTVPYVSAPPSDCPVCSCKWTTDKWLPEVETHGNCECSVGMCRAYLQPPNPGQPLECPWYGCPSGMPGPSGPSGPA